MVLFDNNFLSFLLNRDARSPLDSNSGEPVQYAQERVEYLIQCLDQSRERILIPSPALAEVLVFAGDAMGEWLTLINNTAAFEIADFDQRTAIELALMEQFDRQQGDKRGGSDDTWAKVKFDRQIIAIAKVHRVSVIYSDDGNLKSWAERHGIKVTRLEDIDLPPELAQGALPFDERSESD